MGVLTYFMDIFHGSHPNDADSNEDDDEALAGC